MKNVIKVIFVSAMIFASAKSVVFSHEYLLNTVKVTYFAEGLPYEH
jgi:hypothetical protein